MPLALDHYRLLGRSGLRVSPLSLGTMTFGTEWGWGSDEETSRLIFDAYAEGGGNFIDSANFYTGGTSETFLGRFLEGRREQFVLATKYTLNMRPGDPNAGGNHRKNLMQSLDASLKRLRTEYIDLYWVHAWEFRTPIDEIMRALDDAVRAGKVLYVGISDTPAWTIARANTMAELRGWTPFVALQTHYNLIERTSERELIPMSRELGIGVLPWSPLAGGVLTGKYGKKDLKAGSSSSPEGGRADVARALGMLSERNLQIADSLRQVAEAVSRTSSQVALRWLLHQPGVTSPILGARKLEQLQDNLGCLEFDLGPEQLATLDEVSRIEMGFPHDFMATEQYRVVVDGGNRIEGGPLAG
jgi:aryl-alcohol dehydrogenase-like predicted oxidoreductase